LRANVLGCVGWAGQIRKISKNVVGVDIDRFFYK